MDPIRRTLLKGAGATGALSVALAAGLLKPTQVLAAEWNKAAFGAHDIDGAAKALGASGAANHKDLIVKAPDIAENGAIVPVDVVSNIPNTISLAVMVVKNPLPLSAVFDFANGALPDIAVRLKISETSAVRAIAKTSDGKYYMAQKDVKVTVGGCGG